MEKRITKVNLIGKEVKEMKKVFILALIMGIATFLTIGVGSANALTVASQIFPGAQQFDDDDAEALWVDNNQNGLLDVGDVLFGVLSINKVQDLNEDFTTPSPQPQRDIGASGVNELSGIFAIEVQTRTYAFEFDLSPNDGVVEPSDIYDFTFSAWVGFETEVNNYLTTDIDLPVGAMAAIFEDVSPDYDNSIANSINGTYEAAFGFDGLDNDEQWLARGPLSPVAASTGGSAASLSFNYQVSILYQNLGFLMAENAVPVPNAVFQVPPPGDGFADIVGSGFFEAGAIGDPWDVKLIRSLCSKQFQSQVR